MNSLGCAVRVALMVCLSVALCFSAPETITKLSAPFSFPTSVGIFGTHLFQANKASFLSNTQLTGKKAIELSWAFPVAAKNGNISIFTVNGSKVKTFAITSQTGKVIWNFAESKKIGKGVYFAAISYGAGKQNLKLFID
jgi:hypothetical protein